MKTPVETAVAVWKPVLIRALVAAIFGFSTIFLREPGVPLLKYGVAAYLVFSGTAMWEYLRREPVPEAMRSPLSMAAAAWMLGAIVLLFLSDTAVIAWVAAAALALGGVAELVAWARHRREFVPARDQLYTGLVGVGTAVGLLLFQHLDPHGLMGIIGGGAIIIAVVMAISGFGFRHDAGSEADSPASGGFPGGGAEDRSR